MTTTYIIIIAICILFSGYFSATETAFSSLSKTRLRTAAEKGDRRAALTLNVANQYDKLLSTILIGNNIVNLSAASLGTVLFVSLYGDIGATISTAVITVIVLIFGEISPKSVAKDCPEKFAMISAPYIRILMVLFTPLNFLFSAWKKLLSRIFRLNRDSKMSQDELLMLVQEVQQDGSIDQNEGELLRNAIEFSEQEAKDILTHRVDLEGVPVDATLDEVAHAFSETYYSRLLVYEDSMDHIVGTIHQKDLYQNGKLVSKSLSELITPAIFVLKTEKISHLLRKLQRTKSHLAVVIDEYGGTYGIVTMEDILEELVGEIWDEHDEVTQFFQKAGNVEIADGAVSLDDFCNHFNIHVDSEMVSLSGWITEQLGGIASVGQEFEYEGLRIRVASVENHRVLTAEIQRPARKQASGEAK